jgi:hypothetical protein
MEETSKASAILQRDISNIDEIITEDIDSRLIAKII